MSDIYDKLHDAGYDRFSVEGDILGLCSVRLWKIGDWVASITVEDVSYQDALHAALYAACNVTEPSLDNTEGKDE